MVNAEIVPDTCDRCSHWHIQPADPMNLGATRHGECRACPPQVSRLPTRQGLQIVSGYPLTPAGLPACGHFQSSEEESLHLQHEVEFSFRRKLYDLAVDALSRGDGTLYAGYSWLAENRKYPQRDHEGLYFWAKQEYPEPDETGGKAAHVLPADVCHILWADDGRENGQKEEIPSWRKTMSTAFAQAALAVGVWLSARPPVLPSRGGIH